MSVAAVNFALDQELKSTEKVLLLVLAWHTNEETGDCFPSVPTLLKETGLNPRTLSKAIANLESAGIIRKTATAGKVNHYEIALDAPPAGMHPLQKCSPCKDTDSTPCKNAGTPPAKMQVHPLQKCTPKYKERNIKKKIKMPFETLPVEWWVACRNISKDLNPKAVFEEFKDYWLSDSAKGNGLKSDWLRTWKNWVRSTKVKPFNAAPSGRAFVDIFEDLYRGTAEEEAAEKYFYEHTGLFDFGRLASNPQLQEKTDNRQEREVRSCIRSVLAGGGLAITGASKNA